MKTTKNGFVMAELAQTIKDMIRIAIEMRRRDYRQGSESWVKAAKQVGKSMQRIQQHCA
jgi:hypothetical protein